MNSVGIVQEKTDAEMKSNSEILQYSKTTTIVLYSFAVLTISVCDLDKNSPWLDVNWHS